MPGRQIVEQHHHRLHAGLENRPLSSIFAAAHVHFRRLISGDGIGPPLLACVACARWALARGAILSACLGRGKARTHFG